MDALSGATRIGRYFTVVSLVPTTLFVAYLYLLAKSGAWGGPVDWSTVLDELRLGDIGLVGVLSVAGALALHPLQFSLVQLYEGYWGVAEPFRTLALARIAHHRRRCHSMERNHISAVHDLARRRAEGDTPALPHGSAHVVATHHMKEELLRLKAAYPENLEDILPTRLGNVLRRYERSAGEVYGLTAVPNLPRLAMVARPLELDYLQSQRMQLELAVRTSVLAFAATLVTVFFMWGEGGWLLLAAVPYAMGYGCYRGAVTVAHEYGVAMSTLVELNRFRLYERLRLPQPRSLQDERTANYRLERILAGDTGLDVKYAEAVSPADDDVSMLEPPAGDETNE
ncbi:hypothetical protein [Sphaerisporangium dianthi]|uniref:DUF4239 domain-containing protein n=1 Tax=Sphaerisporangium dianthi TaxID=1436120 RepID=A0ABV9CNP3_9ACTN